MEWISRDFNKLADELSWIEDLNDYMLDPSCFAHLDRYWGPHTVDRFASVKTKQNRFYTRLLNPGCEAVDAFTVSWATWFLVFCAIWQMEAKTNPLSPRMAFCTVVAPSRYQTWYMEMVCVRLTQDPNI